MLYYLLDYINQVFAPPGFDMFRFLTVRMALAAITSLIFTFVIAPRIIQKLKTLHIGDPGKTEAPAEHMSKKGTPTMGGLILLVSITLSVLLWADIKSVYILTVSVGTLILGGVGILDDYLSVVKKVKKGLSGRYKIVGQVVVGLITAIVVYVSPEFAAATTQTTLPFFKNLNFDFSYLFIPAAIFFITATSNAVNLTDGLDGLATGLIIIAMLAFTLIGYVSGNAIYADYLNIIYLPGSGELTVFTAAIIGAALGFMWYNFYPAQVFMGDTGSLALGGALGIIAVLLKKELLLPFLGGVFVLETISVLIQTSYFKYTRMRTGEGKRVFLMSPIHHHFQKLGWHEPKIVMRFYIIGIILAIISLTSFKIR